MKRLFFFLISTLLLAAIGCGQEQALLDEEAQLRLLEYDLLYVWASDAAHQLPDFVATVGFNPLSHHYGDVLAVTALPAPFSTGNEPHHAGLSTNRRWLGTGGLLSILRGQPEVFFFDVETDPFNPTFSHADDPPNSSVTDEFVSLPNGGFLVTMMGSVDGTQPGRVAEYDANMNRVAEWPAAPPADGSFNPHGISIRGDANLMITSDFINPARTLHIPGGDATDFRGTIRVWNLATRTITRTIRAGDPNNPPGMMEIRFIPRDRRFRAYAPGTLDGRIYLIDPIAGTATSVFDLNTSFSVPGTPAVAPALTAMTSDGDRLFVALEYFGGAGKVVMFDISNPTNPTVIRAIDLGSGSGPHYMRLTPDEHRLVVSDYFLVEDLAPGGVVQAGGDNKIHVFWVLHNDFFRDPLFHLDMDNAVPGYNNGVRPHAVIPNRAN